MQINYPLVSAAPELKRQILLFLDKFSVYQRINIGKHFAGDIPFFTHLFTDVFVKKVSGKTPDIFLRKAAFGLL